MLWHCSCVLNYHSLFVFFQGDVWICMELMDTSLDKFYKKVIEKGKTIPEDILGKITVAVCTVPCFTIENKDMETVLVHVFVKTVVAL